MSPVDPAFDQPDQPEAGEEEDPESLCSAPVGPTEADNKCQVSRHAGSCSLSRSDGQTGRTGRPAAVSRTELGSHLSLINGNNITARKENIFSFVTLSLYIFLLYICTRSVPHVGTAAGNGSPYRVTPAGTCARQVCGEQLRRFFHEESEEWHLRDCIRVEGKAYHPGCFEDHKVSWESARPRSY